MSHYRTAIIATVAALTLGGSMVAFPAAADAHTYSKEGSVTAKEANKLFKQAFKQRCLTQHEAQHIAHGSGSEDWSEGSATLTYQGTRKSHISTLTLTFDANNNCVTSVSADKSY